MITKKQIEDILKSNTLVEERRLQNTINKALSPFVLIDPIEKSEELFVALTGKESQKEEKREKSRGEYDKFELEIVAYWNDFIKKKPILSSVLKISSDRRKHLKQRFTEAHFKENYKSAINKIADCPFLLGENARKWKISFDFLVQNDKNYIKILEGAYGNASASGSKGINAFLYDD